MASPLEIVLVDDDGIRRLSLRSGAQELPYSLFWGPDYGKKYVLAQADGGWDPPADWRDGFAGGPYEGGLLMDSRLNVILLFGGEGLQRHIPLRRTFLGLMQMNWPHWRVNWAPEGAFTFSKYVGVPREPFLPDIQQVARRIDYVELKLREFRQLLSEPIDSPVSGVVDVFWGTGGFPAVYKVSSGCIVQDFLYAGPDCLLTELQKRSDAKEITYDDVWDFPIGGLHLDLPSRAIGWWAADDDWRLLQAIQETWPGWELSFWGDQFESQLALLPGRLLMPSCDVDTLVDHLRECLVTYCQPSLEQDGFVIDEDKREEIFAGALASYLELPHRQLP